MKGDVMFSLFQKRAILVLAVVVLWEVVPRAGMLDRTLVPTGSEILGNTCHLFLDGVLLKHTLLSLKRALIGLLAALFLGLPLGLLLGGWFPRLQQGVEPLMELFAQANPVILAHIIIFFLGIGEAARTFIIGWLCIWPIIFCAVGGIQSVDQQLVKAGRSLGLGRLRLFAQVVLPSAAPALFTGVRLASGYAFVMLVASEMMGANSGLGYFVVQSQETFMVQDVYSGVVVTTLLAVACDAAIRYTESRLVIWGATGSEDYLNLKAAPQR